jgi:hypothetical protein
MSWLFSRAKLFRPSTPYMKPRDTKKTPDWESFSILGDYWELNPDRQLHKL